MLLVDEIIRRSTDGAIYVCSLPNAGTRGDPERHVLTRDPDKIKNFVERWDQKGRGLYYCVSTIAERQPRRKENCKQTTFLYVDVDFKDIECTPEEAERAVESLKPSRMHLSGNGIHALWLLREPVSDPARVEMDLRRLAVLVGGDPKVC